MAREKMQTLTEQMFYTLLCLYEECCGTEIMKKTSEITDGRVQIGSGTLYNLIDQFLEAGLIDEVAHEERKNGRKRTYVINRKGVEALENECSRLKILLHDFEKTSMFQGEAALCQNRDATQNTSCAIGACLTTKA